MFFDLVGTQMRTESHGVVADLCPYCGDVRVFEVKDKFRVAHLLSLHIGGGTFVARIRECGGCYHYLSFDATKYEGVAPLADACIGVAALLVRTNPRLVHRLQELERLEEMAKASSYREQGVDMRLLECVHLLRWLSSADVDEAAVHRVASWSGLDEDQREALLAQLRGAGEMLRSAL